MEERPSLIREIGKVAWLSSKVVAVTCAVVAVVASFAWLISIHPLFGMIAFSFSLFAAQIVFLGWQNYRWKLKDLEGRRKWEADTAKWKRAS
jgi:hypothetical protein